MCVEIRDGEFQSRKERHQCGLFMKRIFQQYGQKYGSQQHGQKYGFHSMQFQAARNGSCNQAIYQRQFFWAPKISKFVMYRLIPQGDRTKE